MISGTANRNIKNMRSRFAEMIDCKRIIRLSSSKQAHNVPPHLIKVRVLFCLMLRLRPPFINYFHLKCYNNSRSAYVRTSKRFVTGGYRFSVACKPLKTVQPPILSATLSPNISCPKIYCPVSNEKKLVS